VFFVPPWKDHAIVILRAFRQRKQKELRKQNDTLVKNAVLSFSTAAYELAVLAYVLSKIVSKPRFFHTEMLGAIREVERMLNMLVRLPETASEEELQQAFEGIKKSIAQLEKEDPRFLTSLVSKGQLKIGATMYAQGISLGRASEITGMNKQDILDYAGKTMMFDRLKEEKSIHERLKTARRLLG
jgi:hypothetical protein